MATQVTVITGEGSTSYSVSTGARGPQGVAGAAGAPGTTDYTLLTNVPATFPPEAHTHSVSDIVSISGKHLLGRHANGSGSGQEVTVGNGIEFSGSGIRIADDGVTNARLANVATATIKGRITAGTGDPEDLTAAQALSLIGAETPAGAAAKDDALLRKTQTEVAFIGDSITDQNDTVVANTSYYLTSSGYPNWTAYHLKGRIRLLPISKTFSKSTFGTSGFKIHQIRGTLISNFTTRPENEILGSNSPLATMLGRIAKRKVIVVDLSGANDVADTFTYTAAQVALKRKCLWEEMIVGGVLPSDIVAIALLPYGSSTTTAFADAINNISINDAASLGINWMPYPAVLKSAGAANPSYYRDNIHPNKIGAFLLGEALAAVLNPKVTQDEIELPASTSNRWLSRNPYVTGTQSVSGTRYSGNIATGGWTIVGSVLANTLVELSKYTDSEGEWQRFVVTGTERNGGLGLSNNITTAIPAGTRYRLVARVRSTGFYNYTISCVQNSSTQAAINQEGTDLIAQNPLDLPAFDGILYSPVMVAIGGLGIEDVRFNTMGQGTLDIRQVGILRDDEQDLLSNDQGGSIVARSFNNTPALPNFDCTVMISAVLSITQSLPDALTVPGRRYLFVRTDANATTITIDPSGSQTINGAATFVFAASTSQYQRLHVQAHSGNWIIIGN